MESTRARPDHDLQEILEEGEQERRRSPLRSWLHLAAPLCALAGICVALWFAGILARVAHAALVAFFTVGKLIIVSGAIPRIWKMNAYELALLVFVLDVWVAWFFAFNLHHIYRIPRMGPWLQRLQGYCRWWLATQPWMKKWAFVGVALFVMFPLTGTGAPGGSILGRLGGLRAPPTLLAIATGSAVGCGILAALARPLEPVFHDIQHEWWFHAIGYAVLGMLLIVLLRLGRRLSRAAAAYAKANTGGDA